MDMQEHRLASWTSVILILGAAACGGERPPKVEEVR
jgi:hypothetical protein